MTYIVKEMYYTLQGEGANAGRPAVFCRFSGCNLWTGRVQDRPSAICRFCDTDFVGVDGPGGGRFASPADLVTTILEQHPLETPPFVVLTGGEPLLQVDTALIDALADEGAEIAIETNGTLPCPPGIDWICVSPKGDSDVVQRSGDELKLVFPQVGVNPERFLDWDFRHFFLQPMDGPEVKENTEQAVEFCLRHPRWRLSLQTHKLIGLP